MEPTLSTVALTAGTAAIRAASAAAAKRITAHALGSGADSEAVSEAVAAALDATAINFPSAQAEGFDIKFLKSPPVLRLLSRYLTLDQQPTAGELAALWTPLIKVNQPNIRRIHNWASVFLSAFERALLRHPSTSARSIQRLAVRHAIDDLGETAPLLSYLEWVERRTRHISTRGLSDEPEEVVLDSCFMRLRANEDASFGRVDRPITRQEMATIRSELERRGMTDAEIEEKFDDDRLLGPSDDSSMPDVDIAAQLERQTHLVILGDPGSGKSTLLRYLAHSHADGLHHGWDSLAKGMGRCHLPILVRITDYIEMPNWSTIPFSEFVVGQPSQHECPNGIAVAQFLRGELRKGGCLILIDGLDEIPRAADRQSVSSAIIAFADEFGEPQCSNKIVVTSRVAGYRAAPLTNRFRHLRLRELDEDNVREYASRWCMALQPADLPHEDRRAISDHLVDDLMRYLDQNAPALQLARTPLLLTMILLRIRSGRSLSPRRASLYADISSTLIGSWRNLHLPAGTDLPDERDLLPVLSTIAYKIHAESPTGLIHEKELVRILEENEIDPSLIAVLREHSGVLLQRAPERYGFAHRTFQEFFAGRHAIVDRSDGERAQWILSHRYDPIWLEPLLLGLGLFGESSPAKVRRCLAELIWPSGFDGPDAPETEQLFGFDFVLFLRALADDLPTPQGFAPPCGELLLRLIDEDVPPWIDWTNERQLLARLGRVRAGKAIVEYLSKRPTESGPERGPISLLRARLLDHPTSVLSDLEEMMRRGRYELAIDAARCLGDLADEYEDAAGVLTTLIQDLDVSYELRRHLIYSTGLPLKNSIALKQALLSRLGDRTEHWSVRRAASGRLTWFFGAGPGVVEAVVAIVGSAKEQMVLREACLSDLVEDLADHADTLKTLSELLASPSASSVMRIQASEHLAALRRLGNPEARMIGQRLFERAQYEEAILALTDEFPDPSLAVPILSSRVNSTIGSPDEQELAIRALGILASTSLEAVGSLEQVCISRQAPDNLRIAAIAALGKGAANDRTFVERLVLIGGDATEPVEVRISAVRGLREMGLASNDSVRPLFDLISSGRVDKDLQAAVVELAVDASLTDDRALSHVLAFILDRTLWDFQRASAARSLQRIGYRLDPDFLKSALDSLLDESRRPSGRLARQAFARLFESRQGDATVHPPGEQ